MCGTAGLGLRRSHGFSGVDFYQLVTSSSSLQCAPSNYLAANIAMRDRDVRTAVMTMLNREHGADEDTRIVEEMGIWSGSVRIDIAVINGTLSGFELKSDRDTLERLPLQIDLYSKVFDHVVLVVAEKHAPKALQCIPEWWGVTVASVASAGVGLAQVRLSRRNPAPDPRIVAKLLWRDEALRVLEAHGLAKGWRSKPVAAIQDRLADALTLDELSAAVREGLKSRQQWLRQAVGDQREMAVHADLDPSLPTT